MSFFRAILFPLLLPVSWAVAVDRVTERTTCSEVHLFLARGNGESYPGRVGDIYTTVCNGLPSCDYENIAFDSSQSYCAQASDGVSSGISQIAAYASACPNAKLVLAGYSLGAQIVGDILGGGGGNFYGCTENNSGGISAYSTPGNKIAAVLMFGDVRHVADEPYNVGPGSGDNGQYPRSGSSLSGLNEYSSITQSYCLATDPICALGDDGLSHETYMTVYANAAGAWAQQILAGGSSGGYTYSNVPSTTSTTYAPPPSTSSTTSTSTPIYTYSPPTDVTSSTSQYSAPSTSSSIITTSSTSHSSSTSSSVQSTTSSSTSVNSATFSPFVFSNTTTTAFSSSANSPSSTTSLSLSATITTAPSVTPEQIATSSSTPPPASTKSKAGAYSNSAQLTLNLVTLIVIKVLAF